MHGVDLAGRAIVSEVPAAAVATTLIGPNMNRRGMLVYNNGSTPLLIKYGAGAAANSFTGAILSGNLWEMPRPIFPGEVSGIWEGAPSGNAYVTELL